jgi:HicB family
MARYALNLPAELKKEAELLAERQGISLNQFILWSVAEKVGALRQGLEDPDILNLAYHHSPGEGGVASVLRPTP